MVTTLGLGLGRDGGDLVHRVGVVHDDVLRTVGAVARRGGLVARDEGRDAGTRGAADQGGRDDRRGDAEADPTLLGRGLAGHGRLTRLRAVRRHAGDGSGGLGLTRAGSAEGGRDLSGHGLGRRGGLRGRDGRCGCRDRRRGGDVGLRGLAGLVHGAGGLRCCRSGRRGGGCGCAGAGAARLRRRARCCRLVRRGPASPTTRRGSRGWPRRSRQPGSRQARSWRRSRRRRLPGPLPWGRQWCRSWCAPSKAMPASRPKLCAASAKSVIRLSPGGESSECGCRGAATPCASVPAPP